MRPRILATMGVLTGLLALIGCAPEALEDRQTWEDGVASAAATVPGVDAVEASYDVTGGMSERRTMLVTANVEATSTPGLTPLVDAIEEAVAPAVVGLPVKGATLRIKVTGLPSAEGAGKPTEARSILLDDLATKYDLPRG